MTYKILIGLAGLFGVFRLFKTTDNFARSIVLLQVIAIGQTFIPNIIIKTAGHLLFMLTLLLTLVYGATRKEFKKAKRIAIVILSVSVLIADTFIFQQYPYTGLVSFIMIIPVATYLIILSTDSKSYKNELGFLTIIAVDAAIKFAVYISGQ